MFITGTFRIFSGPSEFSQCPYFCCNICLSINRNGSSFVLEVYVVFHVMRNTNNKINKNNNNNKETRLSGLNTRIEERICGIRVCGGGGGRDLFIN